MSFTYYEDPILGKGRAQVDNGSGGSGGSSYVGGDRINIAGGTISFVNSADIVNVTGASVTLQPNTAYKIYATSQAITLNANPPAAGKWAYEGHLEIFTAGTGYVVTGPNVVLANALEPDAVNNCTVRFHDGLAIISVEDHVAGYIVVSATGTSAGSLYYGLGTASEEYIAVDASLNGQVLDLGGVVTSAGEKHLVGNGYTETIVSGGINCTSKTTLSNLAADGVIVSSGTLTLGDAFIPSGSTVAVSGGGLAVEKVSGNGGVIDLGGTNVPIASRGVALVSGCTFANGSTTYGGAVHVSAYANAVFNDCVYSGNIATTAGGAMFIATAATVTLSSCSFDNNSGPTAVYGRAIYVNGATTIKDCTLGVDQTVTVASGYAVNLDGTFKTASVVNGSGSAIITSGAILDLTGNTNATPIAPGGGITFASGGATVYPSAGQASAVVMGGGVVSAVKNDGTVIVLSKALSGGASGFIVSGTTQCGADLSWGGGIVSSCKFINNKTDYNSNGGGAGIRCQIGEYTFKDCIVEGNVCSNGGGITQGLYVPYQNYNTTVRLSGCTFGTDQYVRLQNPANGVSASVILEGYNKFSARVIGTGSRCMIIVSSNAIIDLTDNSNVETIAPNGGDVIVDGGCQVITSAGSTVSIAGGTYTKINNDGTTE